jgi:NAD(P)-dependent dehydrogenase (short-subunit alcohol dehydrogenase family)
MRILVVGGAGTIGRAVTAALGVRNEVITAGRRSGDERADIADPASIRALYARVGRVDAVVSCAGEGAYKPLAELTDDDFRLGLESKLMGQVNLVRYGIASVADRGSFTLTSGVLNRFPTPGAGVFATVNGALDAFVRVAALELPRGIRINVVSPGWVSETLAALGRDPAEGLPAVKVAEAYVRSVESRRSGELLEPAGTRHAA